MTAAIATAAWSLDALTLTVGRRGWGDQLAGKSQKGVRAVLDALWRLLPHESAEGDLTAAQVADVAGYSLKWTRHCLQQLEALGVITWRRGYLKDGRPQAGWIRVSKRRLAELARKARGYLDDIRHDRARETAQRIRDTLQRPTTRQKPLSRRWEVASTLPTPRGSNQGFTPRPARLTTQQEAEMTYCETCGLNQDSCKQANQRVPWSQRHTFRPRPNRRAIVALPTRDDRRPAPAGWRSFIRPAHPELDYSEGSDE